MLEQTTVQTLKYNTCGNAKLSFILKYLRKYKKHFNLENA